MLKASRATASPCPVSTNCCGVGRSKLPEFRRRSSVRPWLGTTADLAVLTCPRGSSRLPLPKPPFEGPYVYPAANPGISGLRHNLETGGNLRDTSVGLQPTGPHQVCETTGRYQLSRWTGSKPNSVINRFMSETPMRKVVPAELTTFSSIMMDP